MLASSHLYAQLLETSDLLSREEEYVTFGVQRWQPAELENQETGSQHTLAEIWRDHSQLLRIVTLSPEERKNADHMQILTEKFTRVLLWELENESISMQAREEAMKERVQEMEDHHLQDEARDGEGALTLELLLLTMEAKKREEEKGNGDCRNSPTYECAKSVEKGPLTNEYDGFGETKLLCWRSDQCAECMDSEEQAQELQEELKMVSAKLSFARTQRQALQEVAAASATKLAEVMTENEELKKELFVERQLVQARENEVHNLETHMEAVNTSNQMLKSLLNLKKMAGCEATRRSFNFATTLEPKLLDLAAMVSSQNACVVRLSAQNETLARSLQARTLEREQHQAQIATAVKQKDAAIRALEQFKERMVEWATEMDERSQHYETVQEYILTQDAELRDCQSRYGALLQSYEELRKDRDQVLAWQAHARTQIADSEKALSEREKEVESISREALHMSLEVELLRRNLQQLDEDVMFKEGQISILRGRWEEE